MKAMAKWVEIAHEGEFPDGRGGFYKLTKETLVQLMNSIKGGQLAWDIGHAYATSENINLTHDEARKAGIIHGFSSAVKVDINSEGKYALYAELPRFSNEAKAMLKKKPFPSIAFVVNQVPSLHSVSLVAKPNIDLPPIQNNSGTVLFINAKQNITMNDDRNEFRALAILAKIFNKQVADVFNDLDTFFEYATANSDLLAQYVSELEAEADAVENAKSNNKTNKPEKADEDEKNQKTAPPKMNEADAVMNAVNAFERKANLFVNSKAVSALLESVSSDKRDDLKQAIKTTFVAKLIENKGLDADAVMNAATEAITTVQKAMVKQKPISIDAVLNSSVQQEHTQADAVKSIYQKLNSNLIWK